MTMISETLLLRGQEETAKLLLRIQLAFLFIFILILTSLFVFSAVTLTKALNESLKSARRVGNETAELVLAIQKVFHQR